jgi:hypothetical protein
MLEYYASLWPVIVRSVSGPLYGTMLLLLLETLCRLIFDFLITKPLSSLTQTVEHGVLSTSCLLLDVHQCNRCTL